MGADFEEADDDIIGTVPRNTLSTPLGRFVDRVSFRTLAVWVAAVIGLSTIYFCIAGGTPHGLASANGATPAPSFAPRGFWASFYFSIVTFTSLGYGDLTPLGFGRVVACLEVLLGLMLTALSIGKLASERQSALLLLIYTSDQQRRLAKFAAELREFTARLDQQGCADLPRAKSCAFLVRSLGSYLVFQSHQGRLAEFGNGSALRNLYRAMSELQRALEIALRTLVFSAQVEEQLMKISRRNSNLADKMRQFHIKDDRAALILKAIAKVTVEIDRWEATAVSSRRLEQVFRSVPPRPWPRQFDKAAAQELGISRGLFIRCMNELKERGRL